MTLRIPGVGILLARIVEDVCAELRRGRRIIGLSGSLESGLGMFDDIELRGSGLRGGQAKEGGLTANGASTTCCGSAKPISSSCWKAKFEPEGVVKTAALLPRRLKGLLNVDDPKRLARFELSLVLAGVNIVEVCHERTR